MIEPLCITERVDCSVEHAFETWTARFGTWWPRDHTVSGVPDVEVVLEPRVGGRIFERTPDGAETDWGEITVWEAPRRIAYLWHIRRDRADATEVEITFVPSPDGGTRVQVVHAGWERLGAGAEAWRDANRGGWSGLLPHFLAACASSVPARPTNDQDRVELRGDRMNDAQGNGTPASPWRLTTPPGRSEFEAYRDEASDPPALVVQVGKTQLRYHLRCVTDLHEMLRAFPPSSSGWGSPRSSTGHATTACGPSDSERSLT